MRVELRDGKGKPVKRICVFCGSSPGSGDEFMRSARDLGLALARKNLALVYGGGNVGLMGQVAQACLEGGGEVYGVITRQLVDMEVALTSLKNLEIVESMHERKARMADMADGFIAMPGGLGTLDEFFEIVTWAQLGLHNKPCGLLNTAGYFDRLLEFLDAAVEKQFIGDVPRSLILTDITPDDLLEKFSIYKQPKIDKGAWARKLMEDSK